MKLYESLIKNIGIGMATANKLAVEDIIKHYKHKSIENLVKYLNIPDTHRWLDDYCEEMLSNNMYRDFIVKDKPFYGVESRWETPFAYYEQAIDYTSVINVDGVDIKNDETEEICILRLDENSLYILANVPKLDRGYAFLDKSFTKHRQDTIQNHLQYTDMYIYDWKDTKTFNLTDAIK